MTRFEKFLLEKNIPIDEVSTSLERLLLRTGLISMPIGLLSYWKRAVWFSLVFTVLFLGLIEFVLRVFVGISLFNSVPPEIIFLSVCILLLFGPVAAFFPNRAAKSHRAEIESFIREQ